MAKIISFASQNREIGLTTKAPCDLRLTRLREVKHFQMTFGMQRPLVPRREHPSTEFTGPG